MFELFCAVFGDTRAMLWFGGASLAANSPEVQGTLFTVLTCREVLEFVTRFYRRRDACFRKP